MNAHSMSAAAIIVGALVWLSPGTPATRYPQLAMYSWMRGNGAPFVRADGTLDTATIKMQARWDVVVLDPAGAMEHPNVLAMLRGFNPGIRLLAFALAHSSWPTSDSASYPAHYNKAVARTDGWLYGVDGKPYWNANVNLARRDSTGRYVTAEAVADTMAADLIAPNLWDGIFVDVNCLSVDAGGIDYQRAGYRTRAAFDSGFAAGHRVLAARLRSHAPPGFQLVGNCGPHAERDLWNGWMRENWPNQDGGTWTTNMIGMNDDPGYLADDSLYRAPTLMWLSSMPDVDELADTLRAYSGESCRRLRFGLASATLAGGVHTFVWTQKDHLRGFTPSWYDEYSVNAQGHATGDASCKGWLGRPLGGCYQAGVLWRRDFEHGAVLVNPTWQSAATPTYGFARIAGRVCPKINTGAADSIAVLGGQDGLFLWRTPH